jgi:chloramphenicol-sensitive protein RarD
LNRGIIFAVSAYIFWGLHPIYWKLLKYVPSTQIVSHRIIWSFIFFTLIISFRKEWKGLIKKIRENKNKSILYVPAFLIGSNWAMYIWAVNAGFIIETSLGYYICPLISVFLGVIFLKENLRRLQWIAVFIAGIGVFAMTIFYGQFPWISLYLAATWGTYGLLRKKSPLNSVEGLLLETTLLSVPAFLYVTYVGVNGIGMFTFDIQTALLLVGSGITSGLPLLVFIAGARMINLSLVGILQYIYPTLIFLIGVFIYDERLTEAKIIGLVFIWIAVLIYIIDTSLSLKRKRLAVTTD